MQKKLDELKIKLQDALTKDEIIVDSITFEEKAFYDVLICENGYPPEWNAEACEKVLE